MIGQTSEMRHHEVFDRKGYVDYGATAILSRASEIKAYIEKHEFKSKGVRYVIIDDMDLDQDDDLRRKLIKTNRSEGLTVSHVVEAITRLNM
jgi:hypothetical protein